MWGTGKGLRQVTTIQPRLFRQKELNSSQSSFGGRCEGHQYGSLSLPLTSVSFGGSNMSLQTHFFHVEKNRAAESSQI